MSFLEEIKGKRVLVYGLGLQGGGVGDALWLHAHGAEVRVTDLKSASELSNSLARLPAEISQSLGAHREEDLRWADLVVKNPGVADSDPNLLLAASLGKSIVTSIAIFVRDCPIPVIGITGTRGKSTTTELVYRLLETAYPGKILRGGNIPGTSGLSLLDETAGKEYAVLELSSFQLHGFHALKVSPHLAVVTNLYPDHLNRYPDMEAYARDKEAIVAYQHPQDFTFANQDNEGARALAKVSGGRVIYFSAKDASGWQSPLPGKHNQENLAAALAVAKALKLDAELTRQVLATFKGIPYRQEVIAEVHGIRYINDTTATTPTAALKAIEAAARPTLLIFGGATKNLPYQPLLQALAESVQVQKLIILGSSGIPEVISALRALCGEKIVGQVNSMSEAVALASTQAAPGWDVLLSPGFASFDLFQNEFDRGDQFNRAVATLRSA